MALIVQKFGGTSVGTVERIQAVANRIIEDKAKGHDLVIVVSAMSGETNRLLTLADALNKTPNQRELDVLLSTGEQVTISLLCMALQQKNCSARSYTGGQVGIVTNDAFGKARIEQIDNYKIHTDLKAGRVVVVAGFQGMTTKGDITTLGRGGSDTTAVALAAALKADECQIYTDVDGVYTTDPRVVPKARRLKTICFEEMLEMASLGSKVLQSRSVEFASKYNVTLRVLSSFKAGGGTLIVSEDKVMEKALISGIAFSRDEAQLTLEGVPDRPGLAYHILDLIAKANIEVDMIVQNSSTHNRMTDFTFTVHRNDYQQSLDIIQKTATTLNVNKVSSDSKIVKVSIIGIGMRSHAGIASKMFKILSEEDINIRMISTSEIKISVILDEKNLKLAVRALHHGFNLEKSDVIEE